MPLQNCAIAREAVRIPQNCKKRGCSYCSLGDEAVFKVLLPSTAPHVFIPVLFSPPLAVSFILINHCLNVCPLLVTRKHNDRTVSTALEARAPLIFLLVFLGFPFTSSCFTTLYFSTYSTLHSKSAIETDLILKKGKELFPLKYLESASDHYCSQRCCSLQRTHTHDTHMHLYLPKKVVVQEEGGRKQEGDIQWIESAANIVVLEKYLFSL